jgi:adenylate cyclase
VSSEGFQRKLTTILSADAQDYSRLMGADEVGTLQRLNQARDVIDRTVAQHGGRIVGAAGDSVLGELASPVEAVQCSAEMQQAIAALNAELPDDRKMRWRVGINLGDVMIDGENIFGDGVNVAARLQALAEAGDNCISGAAYDQVEARLPYGYVALGEQRVKNIAKPVRVYCVRMGVEAVEAAQAPAVRRVARRWFRPGRAIAAFAIAVLAVAIFMGPPATSDSGMTPAVAVLPFQAIGDEAAQAEFGEGLTEDLIVALSAHTDLRVVRSDEPGSPQEVGARLHVAYVLDGRIRGTGKTLRITAQLSETSSGHSL